MNTRSQSSYERSALYSVDIDFDEASEAWRANKKSMPNGMFKYICGCPTKSGSKCMRPPKTDHKFCTTHIKEEKKE
jgi:hypothetical protein